MSAVIKSFDCTMKNLVIGILNPIALRKAKIVCNFGLSECDRVKIISIIVLKWTSPALHIKDADGMEQCSFFG